MKANNHLYTDIVINLDLLDIYKNKFVTIGISSFVLKCKSDISKQKGYAVDFEADNFTNELYHRSNAASQNDLCCLSGYLYINVDNA